MWKCPQCGESIEDQFDACWKCAGRGQEAVVAEAVEDSGSPAVGGMIFSTTPFAPGHTIRESRGVVCGEAILGANVVNDFLAGITDIVGGRAGAYEDRLKEARNIALGEMAAEARQLGANAIVGIDIDYENLRGTMLMVTASGTAVVAVRDE